MNSRQKQCLPSNGMSVSYHKAIWLMSGMLKIGSVAGEGVAGLRLEVCSFLANWDSGMEAGKRIISWCKRGHFLFCSLLCCQDLEQYLVHADMK